MRRGFTLLEVLLAAIILGSGLAAILVSMSQAQRMMLASSRQETAQEVMDLGEMAYPLADVKDPDSDLDVPETKAEELWEKITDVRMTGAQSASCHAVDENVTLSALAEGVRFFKMFLRGYNL